MTKSNFGLTTTVAIAPHALKVLKQVSTLSGLPMGQLVTRAVEEKFDPRHNPKIAEFQERFAREVVG